jgi:hypothetical protein
VWTWQGLVTYYTVFVIDLASRRVQILGSTRHPEALFMRSFPGVLDGLSEEQRENVRRVVARVLTAHIQADDAYTIHKQRKTLLRLGGGRIRKLVRRIKRARNAVDDVSAFLSQSGIDSHPSVSETLGRAKELLNPDAVQAAGNDWIARTAAFVSGASMPTTQASESTQILVDFFIGCGCTKNDASLRTAQILNWFFPSNLPEKDRWSETPNRSTAILKRLARRTSRPAPNKSR